MTDLSGSENFYDRVAQKFGEYRTGARHQSEYRDGNPEAVFEEQLLARAGPGKTVLDVGSGDGRFTRHIAPRFGQVVGIDTSEGMLAVARQRQVEQDARNVRFVAQNATVTDFPDASFDVVYSRRGPTPYREIARLLKPGGAFLHIGIGEQDALELKQVFGRGQGFSRLGDSWLDRSRRFQEEAGLRVVFARDFVYDEFYPTYADLETFLQGVPIFEDFDPEVDRAFLETYVARETTEKGIRLSRHRFVTVSEKGDEREKVTS